LVICKVRGFLVLVLVAATLAGCASGRAYRRGQDAARLGDWDTAVAYYRKALMEDPDRLDVRVALERATQSASLDHLSRARRLEAEGQFAAAASEYRRVIDLDAGNQLAAAKAAEMDRLLRDQIEAARPRPEIDQLREQIRREQEAALIPLAVPLPGFRFNGTLRELLELIAGASNVNILIDPNLAIDSTTLNRAVELNLQETTVEGVLRHLSLLYRLFYRTLDPRTILVAKDDVQARQQYEEQEIQTFYLSHSKAIEVGNILTAMLAGATATPSGSRPTFVSHESNNTLTVRATPAVMRVVERIVRTNDRPRAEVVIEVSILEVDRARAKQHGLDLSQYAIGLTLSPELAPPNTSSTPDAFPAQPPPFNANTISRGVSTNDFYLTVPSALIRFLEADTNTRLIAKPNLRGQEGATLTLNLGDEIPIPTTTFGSAAGGGLATIPISQFTYRPVGVNMTIKPKVTYEGEIVLELTVESSGRGPGENVAGQQLPSFTSRKVQTTMRLRDGESNMIAGLLREDERRALRGFPGILRVPVLRDLFTSNDHRIATSDIVMLLTPRIVRTHEITADDLRAINVGTSQNTGIGGQGPVFGSGLTSTGQAPAPMDRTIPGAPPGGVPTQPAAAAPGAPAGVLVPPPNTVDRPVADLPPAPPPPGTPPVPPEPAAMAAQVMVAAAAMVPGTPTTVPVSISNASRLTQLTISVAYDPALLRARAVSQGGFMAQGGHPVTFLPVIDEAAGRVDIVISRPGDITGASGAGLLASIQFDTLAAGDGALAVSGAATSPEGQMLPLQFVPAQFRIR
jgi:general secretion pathway protein D